MHYWVNQFAITPDMPGGTRHYDFSSRLCSIGVPIEVLAADVNLSTRQYTRRLSSSDRSVITENFQDVTFHWIHTFTYEENDWRRSAGMLRFAQEAFRYLLTVPVDEHTVFIGSSPTLFAAVATQLAAVMRGVPFVLEVRDLWPESLVQMTGHDGATAKALRVMADYAYKKAARIILLAKHNQEAIEARGIPADRFVFVPNSVELGLFRDARSLGGQFGLSRGEFHIVYAGAHGPANDLLTALKAAQILKAKGSRVRLVLVGDGVEKKSLQAFATESKLDNVTFIDPIPKSQIPGLFASCDAGLLTLKDIPLFRNGVSPNKLFDYMAAELPVITNVQGDCAEVVRENDCGWVAKPGDPTGLAVIMHQASEQASNSALGAAGRRHVAKHYNREHLVHRLAEVLQSVGEDTSQRASAFSRLVPRLPGFSRMLNKSAAKRH